MKQRSKNNTEPSATTLSIRIQPRASKNKIVRNEDGSFKVWITAPPVDGAANEALIKFLSSSFDVAKSQVEIVSGLTAKNKIVRIIGIDSKSADALLNKKEE
jgi:uncharacterized protein (TIGR00251 family)